MSLRQKYQNAYNSFQRDRVIYDYHYTTPEPPKITSIHNYMEEDEKLRRLIPKPRDYKWSKEEIVEEFTKGQNGFWFFNGSNNNIQLEYITGRHYKMLTRWLLSLEREGESFGYPDFIDAHRDVFYVWDLCDKDPNCFGLLFYTARRWGKTAITSFLCWDYATDNYTANVAIQSKTRPDAEEVFAKIIDSWREMNPAWKPTDSGVSNPKTKLLFTPPSKRSTDGAMKVYTKTLNSKILTFPSTEKALDGLKYKFVLEDEFAKREDTDVRKTWNVVKETLAKGSNIVGKAFCTSTVEELEGGGGEEGKHVWDNSDPKDLNANGRTRSGLWRLFLPAYYGYQGDDGKGNKFVDDWGYSNQLAAKEFLENERKSLEGSDLLSRKRKYPFIEEDMFINNRLESPFPLVNLYSQQSWNANLDMGHVRKGNLVWENGVRFSKVNFYDDPHGAWTIIWQPQESERNQIANRGGIYHPVCFECVSGVDPVDNAKTADVRQSKAASHVFRKFNVFEQSTSEMFVSQYFFRHPEPTMFYEDMIKQCFFFSTKILCESNKIGLINYFKMQGCEGLLMERPIETRGDWSKAHTGEKYGVPSSVQLQEQMINVWQSYIYKNVGYDYEKDISGKLFFKETLDQLISFDIDHWTTHDLVVSGGITLLAAKNPMEKPKSVNVLSLHKKYPSANVRRPMR